MPIQFLYRFRCVILGRILGPTTFEACWVQLVENLTKIWQSKTFVQYAFDSGVAVAADLETENRCHQPRSLRLLARFATNGREDSGNHSGVKIERMLKQTHREAAWIRYGRGRSLISTSVLFNTMSMQMLLAAVANVPETLLISSRIAQIESTSPIH